VGTVEVRLYVEFTPQYPETAPVFKISGQEGVDLDQIEELTNVLNDKVCMQSIVG
jgi:hypothetical protein